MFYEKLPNKNVHCYLCNHHCTVSPLKYGFCGMRQNVNGILYTYAYGEVIARQVDPVDKKPLYHFLPGSFSYSIATMGCNFRCDFCQNWQISQISNENRSFQKGNEMTPEDVVREAMKNNCKSIS